MGPGDDGYRILRDLQRKCNELGRKIDSILRMMELMTTYMQYSGMMAEMATVTAEKDHPDAQAREDAPGNEVNMASMDPRELQRIMNAAKNSDHPMSEGEFQEIFESLKKGKNQDEIARMEQMVQLARSFMK